jgi:hypothetical protein
MSRAISREMAEVRFATRVMAEPRFSSASLLSA